MLNDLNLHETCIITTTEGESFAGVYGGVETQHGDWSVLVRQDRRTLSIQIECIRAASPA